MIDVDTVKRFFRYDPDTGEFRRIAFVNNQGVLYQRESAVESKHQHGYYIAVVEGKRHRVHHLVFLYMTGSLPDKPVDHINGDRTDNRWCNLRLVEKVDNQKNQGVRTDNSTGCTGVYWYPPLSKYQAQITVAGKRVHLGYFGALEDAVTARRAAEAKYGFHENHGKRLSWGR